jgi:hypothetical protein
VVQQAGAPGKAVARTGKADSAPIVHTGLLSVDMERSGDALRDSEAFVQFRRALFKVLKHAFEASGIDWVSCIRHDTGDGMIVIIPPEFHKSLLIYPLLERLSAGLRHHNRYAGAATGIRVRVAIHAGDVRIDEYGVTGRPKVLLARLLDAAPLKTALAKAPDTATVAAIVSDSFHEDVICHGHVGIDPELYTPVTVRVKETEARAWLHIPGHAPRPKPDTRSRGALATAGLLLVMLIALGAALTGSRDNTSSPPQQPAPANSVHDGQNAVPPNTSQTTTPAEVTPTGKNQAPARPPRVRPRPTTPPEPTTTTTPSDPSSEPSEPEPPTTTAVSDPPPL